MVTGKRVRVPTDIASGLDFDDITSAVRAGSTPAECLSRLEAAKRVRSGGDPSLAEVPLLGDLHGYGEAMAWCEALVSDLDAWRRNELAFERLDARVIFSSEPGLGKTSLVRSLAKTANIPLITSSVGSLFATSTGYLDGVIKAWDAVIASAVAQSPSVLFLDELDALPNRAAMSAKDVAWWTPVVTHCLTTLDGAVSGAAGKLIIIGATNHADRLDAALVRPGRLNRIIEIAKPDASALAGIIRQHLGQDLGNVDLLPLAALGAGATGATAMGWVKDARRIARTAKRPMQVADLLAQVAPPDSRSPEALLHSATHEAAHSVLSEVLRPQSLRSVSVVQDGTNGGLTRTKPNDGGSLTRADLECLVVVGLAGRCVDDLDGAATTGAGDGPGSDLEIATKLVASIHASYGLGGALLYRGDPDRAVSSLAYDADRRRKVEGDLVRLHARAAMLVRENRAVIDAVARCLAQRRLLSGDEVRSIIADTKRTHRPPLLTKGGRHG
ncbi:AAA family ATPase [Micromonospora sp. STR1s_5]|nr:AAA family ATPase [Micromonospora sp. STR1s_5]